MKQQVYNNMDTTEEKVSGIVDALNLLLPEQDKAEAVLMTKNWFIIIGTERTKQVIEEAKNFSKVSNALT
jgi:hypothetical protein